MWALQNISTLILFLKYRKVCVTNKWLMCTRTFSSHIYNLSCGFFVGRKSESKSCNWYRNVNNFQSITFLIWRMLVVVNLISAYWIKYVKEKIGFVWDKHLTAEIIWLIIDYRTFSISPATFSVKPFLKFEKHFSVRNSCSLNNKQKLKFHSDLQKTSQVMKKNLS